MSKQPFIVGFGGTTRSGSSSERLIAEVLAGAERAGARTRLFGGASLAALPHFNQEVSERTPEQMEFISAVREADGIVIGTPAYHGGVSALVKNAIDLLEDTRGDRRVYFEGLPIGLIVSAAGWQAGGVTLAALRNIVHAMRGWPTPLGIAVNTVAQPPFGVHGGGILVDDVATAVAIQARQIMEFASR